MAKIAIFHLPFRGRRDEFLPLRGDPGLQAEWVNPHDFARRFPQGADVIVLPGSGATVRDLEYLRSSGGAEILRRHLSSGRAVMGICGGLQILGQTIFDPLQRQGERRVIDGLGLLPLSTAFGPKLYSTISTAKYCVEGRQVAVAGEEHRSGFSWRDAKADGFELLSQQVDRRAYTKGNWQRADGSQIYLPAEGELSAFVPPVQDLQISAETQVKWSPGSEQFDGIVSADRRVWGTYIHLIFHNTAFNQVFFRTIN